jgi:hypothetical protein
VDLKGANVLKIELLRRMAKKAAEFGDGVDIGSLGRRRRKRPVLDV